MAIPQAVFIAELAWTVGPALPEMLRQSINFTTDGAIQNTQCGLS
jgi:hypothetical protein